MPATAPKKYTEPFASQEEANTALADGYKAPDSVRSARKPLDYVPGEPPEVRRMRLATFNITE